MVGNEDRRVPLSKLERHINKLPSNIDGKRIDALDGRLQALGGKTGAAGMPKGPMPASADARHAAHRPPS